jgi:predicted alpha/beta hydrolase family esterase
MGRHFVILHGWQANTPEHWQTWLAERLEAAGAPVCYPVLPDPDHPRLEPWLDALETLLPAERETTVVCHSLACLLWLHHLTRDGRQARALLVAPPSDRLDEPELQSFFPAPRAPLAEGSRLVYAPDDPYCPGGAAARYDWGVPVEVIEGGGHLNADSGYGPWPEVEAWCLGQASAVTSSRTAPG